MSSMSLKFFRKRNSLTVGLKKNRFESFPDEKLESRTVRKNFHGRFSVLYNRVGDTVNSRAANGCQLTITVVR